MGVLHLNVSLSSPCCFPFSDSDCSIRSLPSPSFSHGMREEEKTLAERAKQAPLTSSRRRKKNVGVKSARGEEGGLGGGREAAFLMRGPATNRSLGGNGGGGGGCGGDVGEGELGNNDTARKKRRDVGDGRLTPYSYKRVVICGRRGGGSVGILPG